MRINSAYLLTLFNDPEDRDSRAMMTSKGRDRDPLAVLPSSDSSLLPTSAKNLDRLCGINWNWHDFDYGRVKMLHSYNVHSQLCDLLKPPCNVIWKAFESQVVGVLSSRY